MNLEGRVQRLRRAVIAPVPGRARVGRAARRAASSSSSRRTQSVVFDELSRDTSTAASTLEELGERAPLAGADAVPRARAGRRRRRARLSGPRPTDEHFLGELRLLRYRPLFSGPQVERVAELAVPAARRRGRRSPPPTPTGAGSRPATRSSLRSNGTSVELRARVDRTLVDGRRAHRRRARRRPPPSMVEVVKA